MSRVQAKRIHGTSNFYYPHTAFTSSPQSSHQLCEIFTACELHVLTLIRRSQCDEQHPKCRNCIKSKRECLGYDPIFKQQQAPTQLQPAPNASPSSSSSAPVAGPTPTYPSSSAPYHPVSNGTSAPSATSASVKSEPSQPYEFGSAIDPALAGGGSTAMASSYGSSQFHPPPLGTHNAKQ